MFMSELKKFGTACIILKMCTAPLDIFCFWDMQFSGHIFLARFWWIRKGIIFKVFSFDRIITVSVGYKMAESDAMKRRNTVAEHGDEVKDRIKQELEQRIKAEQEREEAMVSLYKIIDYWLR